MCLYIVLPIRCEESVMAVVPDIAQFEKEGHSVGKGHYRVPLFLVRIDGVIYATGMTFTYAGGLDSSVGFAGSAHNSLG
jgi:hypothetical protein